MWVLFPLLALLIPSLLASHLLTSLDSCHLHKNQPTRSSLLFHQLETNFLYEISYESVDCAGPIADIKHSPYNPYLTNNRTAAATDAAAAAVVVTKQKKILTHGPSLGPFDRQGDSCVGWNCSKHRSGSVPLLSEFLSKSHSAALTFPRPQADNFLILHCGRSYSNEHQ
jgi:hypothetical protein